MNSRNIINRFLLFKEQQIQLKLLKCNAERKAISEENMLLNINNDNLLKEINSLDNFSIVEFQSVCADLLAVQNALAKCKVTTEKFNKDYHHLINHYALNGLRRKRLWILDGE